MSLSFSFNPSALPAYAQTEFLGRFLQLVVDYQTLTAPVPPAPSADTLPAPTAFQPVQGDGADGDVRPEPVAAKPQRKNPWAGLSEEQRQERIAKMRAGRAAAAERKMSNDSLAVPEPAPEMPARTPNNGGVNLGRFDGPAPAPAPAEDAASDTSSKKQRKNPWADLTPEQREARLAKMRAAREAKIAARAAATQVTGGNSA